MREKLAGIYGYFFGKWNTPNANMADHSVIARDEFHESEASEASVFCFDRFQISDFLLLCTIYKI